MNLLLLHWHCILPIFILIALLFMYKAEDKKDRLNNIRGENDEGN